MNFKSEIEKWIDLCASVSDVSVADYNLGVLGSENDVTIELDGKELLFTAKNYKSQIVCRVDKISDMVVDYDNGSFEIYMINDISYWGLFRTK